MSLKDVYAKINIQSKFDGKGFKQAMTATQKLNKNIGVLAKSFAGLFVASKLAHFAKASVAAFAANEKSAAILANTLKNTGQAFKDLGVEGFIKSLSLATGVVKGELRPAFQQLYLATGDVGKSQKALALALDVSKGTGKDLTTVTTALSKAYLGNYTSLTRLGAGLEKSLVMSGDMDKITAVLSTNFAGSASKAAATFSGQMDILGVATTDAKEIIGKGLIDSLKILVGDTSIDTVTKNIEKFAQSISDTTLGIGLMIAQIKKIPGMDFLGKIIARANAFHFATNLGAAQRIATAPAAQPHMVGGQGRIKADAAAAYKATADARKLATTANALAKEKLKTDKAALALKVANKIFDLQSIEIQAALKGKIDEETRNKLLLQQAIIDNDQEGIVKYTELLGQAQSKTEQLTRLLANMPKADNPFADWADYFRQVQILLAQTKSSLSLADVVLSAGMVRNPDGTYSPAPTIAKPINPILTPPPPTPVPTPVPTPTPLTPTPTPSVPTPTPLTPTNPLVTMPPDTSPFELTPSVTTRPHDFGPSGGDIVTYVTVNTGPTLGTTDTITEAVQNAISFLSRSGGLIGYAGQIAI